MATPAASTAGTPRPGRERDVDRLGQRDLLVLRLELELERRRRAPAAAPPQRTTSQRPIPERATRNTR